MRDPEPRYAQPGGLFKWKFRHQLSLMFAAAVLCLALVGALMTSWGASDTLLRNLLHQGAQVTTGFADQSILALIYGSADNAADTARITLGFPGVSHVAIYYPDGESLLEQGAWSDWRPDRPGDFVSGDIPSDAALMVNETRQTWHFLAPVHAPNGDNGADARASAPIGYAHVVLTKAVLHDLRRDIFIHNFGSIFLAAALLLLLLPWLASRMTRPLNELARLMREAEQGDTTVRVRPGGALEVRNMGRAFNLMMETLEQRRQRLDLQNQDLLEQIREREEAERELRVYRDHLQELVDEQTRDLIAARDAALAGERAMSTFLANMSHEIRTPLTAILGFSEYLREAGLSERERSEVIERILRSGHHLLKIINDILDLSKVAALKMEVERLPVAPLDVLAEVRAMAEPQAHEKGIGFDVEYAFPLPRFIQSDALRLRQVLLNLITNAVKFTETGWVKVRVACDWAREELRFEVTDTGIGITADQQARLFNPFTQADASTTRKYGGTGLGLHLAKQFAERMGGGIAVASTPGQGSCFTFTLVTGPLRDVEPVSAPVPDADASRADPRRNAAPKRLSGHVLLAEDNLDNQQLLSMYLGNAGVTVSLADNGEQALELALSNHYDLILMDMQMPVMDGLTAVRLLRQAGYRGPIVAVTANTMREDEERYRQTGCDDFISKPIDVPRFQAMLASHLPEHAVGEAGSMEADILLTLRQDTRFTGLVERFVGRLPLLRQEIDQALEGRDWERLGQLVHDLKGMGSSFGYPGLTRLAADIQSELRRRTYEHVSRLVMSLDSEIDQALSAGGRS